MTYSKKVLQRIEKPIFFSQGIEKPRGKGSFFRFDYAFPNKKGEVTVFGEVQVDDLPFKITWAKFTTNIQEAPKGFLDACVELIQDQPLKRLKSLSVREVEHFLRDTGSEASFPQQAIQMYPYFETFPQLHQYIEKTFLKTNTGKQSPVVSSYLGQRYQVFNPDKMDAKNLNRADLAQLIQRIADVYIRPHLQKDGGDMQIVHFDTQMLAINYFGECFNCEYSLGSTLEYIQTVYRVELGSPDLLVVTDS